MRRWAAWLFVASVATATSAYAQAAFPPLPALTLDSYPNEARTALASADRAARAQPRDAAVVGALGRTLQAWEQWEAAHASYQRAQALAADAWEWRYLDAVVLQRLARPADAVPLLQHVLSRAPDYLPARVRLADALFDAGDTAASRTAYAALVSEPAAEPVAELGLGRLDALAGDHAAAIRHLERAVTLFPDLGAAHYALARSYRAVGRDEAAREALARHRATGTRWPAIDDRVLASVTALRTDARAEANRGRVLAERGDIAGAIAATEAALARDPSLVQAQANLISLYGQMQQWAKAESAYRTVVASGLHLDEAHYNYGVLLMLQSKSKEAAAAYRSAIAVNPLHAQARNNLGQLLEHDQDLAGAEREYRAACDAQPAFRLARFNLARLLIAQGRPADAVAELETLRTPVDSETPRYLFALSVAYLRVGRREDCVAAAREARRLAAEHGQQDLVEAIDRNLATLR